MDDVRAVMDAVGSERAALFGVSEGGAMSMLFAATYPQRTQALVLYGSYAHFPLWVLPPDKLEAFIEVVERTWGTGETVRFFAPSKMADENFKRGWARFERLGASPSAVVALMRMNNEIDVRHVAAAIRVPTLVSIEATTLASMCRLAGILGQTFLVRNMSNCPAPITSSGSAMRSVSLMKSRSS